MLIGASWQELTVPETHLQHSPGTVRPTLNLRGRKRLPYTGSGEFSKLVPKPLKALSAVTLGFCKTGCPRQDFQTVQANVQ